MKSKCKIEGCKSPVWGNDLCTRHKPRKPLPKSRGFSTSKKNTNNEQVSEMKQFFLSVWDKRPHYSEISGKWLGSEPLSIFFHHILPKEKYKEAAFDEENIVLLTLEEHDQVEMDIYRFEEVNLKRQYLKTKYERP